jgi:iron complex outermembrane receptor protein
VEGKRWDGYRDHSAQTRAGLYANAGWQLAGGAVTRFFLTSLTNKQEIPGPLTRSEADAHPGRASARALGGDYRLDVETLRLANKTSWPLAGGHLEIGFSYERQDLYHPIVDKVLVDFDGAGPAAAAEVFSLLIDTDQRDTAAIARYGLASGAHDLTFGLSYGDNAVGGSHYRNDGGRPNGRTAVIANRAASLELYAVDRWRLAEPWLLELAAQAASAERNVRSTDVATGGTRNPHARYSSVSPRIGVIYSLNEAVDLFANASRSYEPPTNFELEDEARGGNAALAAMRATVLEVGGRGRHAFGAASEWRWDFALYRARIADEILSVEDPARPGESLAANVDRTTHSGVEALIGADFALGAGRGAVLAALLSITVNDFAFDGDAAYGDKALPAAPGHVLRGEIVWRGRGGFFIGPTFDVVDERFADFANSYVVPSYTLLGLRAGWSNRRLRWFAELRNLRGASYIASHGVRNAAPADAALLNPGEPRSVYFGFQAGL